MSIKPNVWHPMSELKIWRKMVVDIWVQDRRYRRDRRYPDCHRAQFGKGCGSGWASDDGSCAVLDVDPAGEREATHFMLVVGPNGEPG